MENDENSNSIDDAVASVDAKELEDFLGDDVSVDNIEAEPEHAPQDDSESVIEEKTSDKGKEEVTPDTEDTPIGQDPVGEPSTPTTPSAEPGDLQGQLDSLKAQNQQLTALVEKLSGTTSTIPAAPTTLPTPSLPPSSVVAKTVEELFSEIDFDEVMESKEGFVKFFANAMNAVKAQTVSEIEQRTVSAIPEYVQRQAQMKEVANQFYEVYPELQPVKQYVARVASEISQANPDMTVDKVLGQAAETVRKTLGLQSGVLSPGPGPVIAPKPKPALPGSRSIRQPSSRSTSIEDEISDLWDE